MDIIFSYMVENEVGQSIEDEINQTLRFASEEEAKRYFEVSGYEKVSDNSYRKKINSTLYNVGTLVKSQEEK